MTPAERRRVARVLRESCAGRGIEMTEAEPSTPNEVPLVERLRSIPVDAHLSVHTPNPLGHDTRHWAVGALCHDAAAQLDALRAELEAARAKLVPPACCQEFELCREKCVPLTEHWRERAEKAERAYADMAKRGTWKEAADYSEYWRVRAENAEHELEAARADVERMREALERILQDAHGCRFCDSGRLRSPNNPEKGHDHDCGYLLASVALDAARKERT